MTHYSSTYHKIECAEVSGVFSQEKYHAYTYIDNDPNSRVYHDGIIGDYHLFIRSGNKVYVEAKGSKEVVMSFDYLQKNRYLKYYYDLSLILAKNKHQIIKNEAFNKEYDEIYGFTGKNRLWSLETSYIDYVKQTYNKIYKIVPRGNVCYFKVNPFDIKNMDYTSQQELEHFLMIYMCRKDIMFGNFERRAIIYKEIAEEYAMNENKKQILNLETLNSKYRMSDDILTMLYNMVSIGDRYEYITSKEESDALLLAE